MKVAIFSTKNYDREFLGSANASRHELRFFEPLLGEGTVGLATGFEAVCVFVNDQVNGAVIAQLHSLGVRLITLRCAGYNNVDLAAATETRRHGCTRAGVLPLRSGRAHDCSYAGAEPETASGL